MLRWSTALALVWAALTACASGEQVVPPDGAITSGDHGNPYTHDQDSGARECAQCDDGKPCTRDLCLPGGGCTYQNRDQGAPCDDGSACTTGDACDGAGRCTGTDATDWVYRYKHWGKNTYYYSRSKTGFPKGYGFEKKLFRILRPGLNKTAPLYRLYSTKTFEFMLSLNSAEASDFGYTNNGLIGYVFPKQQPGTVPLHRLVLKNEGRHLSSLDPSEGTAAGFSYEYVQGYVCK